jgi:hypothetical protein
VEGEGDAAGSREGLVGCGMIHLITTLLKILLKLVSRPTTVTGSINGWFSCNIRDSVSYVLYYV